MRDLEDRPRRRSALVARELARLDIDIAAVSEVHFVEQGTLREDEAGYTPFWSGKNKDKRRLSGVSFMIKTSITRKMQNLPVGHSDCIMSLRLPIQDNKFATVLSVYAPTLQAETGVEEAFSHDLHNLLQQVDSKEKLLILGDFNTRVGQDFQLWKGVLGRHGIGNSNDNRCLVLEFCSDHQLVITTTLFQQKDRFKATYRHPRSKNWRLLDYVLTQQHDTRDALHTRADCPVQTAILIVGWYAAKSPLPSSLLQRENVPR